MGAVAKPKPRIGVFGKILGPLHIGSEAFIKRSDNKILRTSPVANFLRFADGRVYIETQNTHYWVFPV